MKDILETTVTTRQPSGATGDLGSCEVAYFTIDDDLLTMVEGNSGVPVRTASGERITARLKPGESAYRTASRLFLAQWRKSDAASDFNRPLHYGHDGWR